MADNPFLADHVTQTPNPMKGLNEFESKAVIAEFGIRVPQGLLVDADVPDHLDLEGLSGPFAVKFMSAAVPHKTDLGGVAINVPEADVVQVCRQMLASPMLHRLPCDGFLVEEMVSPGACEMALGGMQDPTFGPMVMLGVGGIFLEALKDVSFRICPVTEADVHAMLRELKGFPLLEGYRGAPPADLDALVSAVMAVAGRDGLLMSLGAQELELDINPLLVGPDGATAADAQIMASRAPHAMEVPA